MQYEAIPKLDREEIARDLASADPKTISYAILSASLYDPDWRWAQAVCMRFLCHPDKKWIRWNAVTGLSHIARLHRQLDAEAVIPRLEALRSDPEIAPNVEDSLAEIRWWLSPEAGRDRNADADETAQNA